MIYTILYVYLYMIYIKKHPSYEYTKTGIKMTAMVGRKIGLAFQNNGYCSQLKTVQENLILWKVVKT